VNKVLGSGLSALGCLLAAAVVVVAIPAPHAAEPVTVSYRADQARLARLAPYPAVAPRGLPASWQPVGSGLTVGGANGAGTVTWALDYMTPDGLLASPRRSSCASARSSRSLVPMTLAMPRPGRPCRCLMDAAGPRSWPGGGDTMNTRDTVAAGGRP